MVAIGGWEISRMYVPFRSEEHTSELQSRSDLVCRLLLEKKKKGTVALDWRDISRLARRKACEPTAVELCEPTNTGFTGAFQWGMHSARSRRALCTAQPRALTSHTAPAQ